MHDLMVASQEVDAEIVANYRSGDHMQIIAVPTAVAESADPTADPKDVVTPDAESFKALAWASKLTDDSNVLSLIRSLPKEIVEEQVRAYGRRAEAAVAEAANEKAEAAKEKPKIHVGQKPRHQVRMLVAQRFHIYCRSRGIGIDKRLPHGAMKTFANDSIVWKAKQKALQSNKVRD